MMFRVALALETPLRERVERVLAQPDLVVSHVAGGSRLMAELRDHSADLVVATEEALPGLTAEAIPTLRALPERPELVLVTTEEDGDERARLLAAGALAVLPSGLEDDQLRRTFRTFVKRRRESILARLQGPSREDLVASLDPETSESPAMRSLLETARRVARAGSSLLILGETGSGKEWLARGVHAASDRADGPFVAVNCAALSETLLESELFGHERGAFTGAERARRGHFEMAHGGTLFLDEIGDMPSGLQAKLLRAVEEMRIQRLGSEKPFPVDVRLMTATHQNLENAVERKAFRSDLYYRLAVVELTLPPLRERSEDVEDLARHFVGYHRRKVGRGDVTGISDPAMAALAGYAWPGNVRELGNVLERAVLLTHGPKIGTDDLPRIIEGRTAAADGGLPPELFRGPLADGRALLLDAFEREYFDHVLRETGGRVDRAAERAGIDVRTLREKLERLGIDRKGYR